MDCFQPETPTRANYHSPRFEPANGSYPTRFTGSNHTQTDSVHPRLLEQILNRLPAGIVVVDINGYVSLCNPMALAQLGEPLDDTSWCEVMARAFRPRPDDGYDVSLGDGRRLSVATQALGEGFGQLLLLTDVTETRYLQDRLNQQERLLSLGEMMAALAHQIRTPLATAVLYASYLEQPDLIDSKRSKFACKVMEQLQHLERLIKHMLFFIRGGRFARDRLDLNSVLAEFRKLMEPHLNNTGGKLTLINDAFQEQIYGNKEAILTALQNLACNALQACPEHCQLMLHVLRSESAFDLILADNGPGIEPSLQEQIFEPFFTTRSRGTGLGLAVVRAIAKAHDGAVWVDSCPGEGCRFTLRLPRQSFAADSISLPDGQAVEQV